MLLRPKGKGQVKTVGYAGCVEVFRARFSASTKVAQESFGRSCPCEQVSTVQLLCVASYRAACCMGTDAFVAK